MIEGSSLDEEPPTIAMAAYCNAIQIFNLTKLPFKPGSSCPVISTRKDRAYLLCSTVCALALATIIIIAGLILTCILIVLQVRNEF
jgi:hypothetical protein